MGVVVLGMHRSGTSAVTAAIASLGVPLGDPDDRIPALDDQDEDFHESARLSGFNEGLLERLGGRWDAPPALQLEWESLAETAREVVIARELFFTIHRTPTWVWKDPSVCLLLPFWRKVLGDNHKLVFVTRSPLAVARSLRKRNRLTKPYALALWERYTREALYALAGRPVLVVDSTAVTSHPARLGEWARELAAFVAPERAGDTQDPERAVTAAVHVTPGPHAGAAAGLDRDPEASPSQRRLAAIVAGLTGTHAALELPRLPPESLRTSERFTMHQACAAQQCMHRSVAVSVPWRPARSAVDVLTGP